MHVIARCMTALRLRVQNTTATCIFMALGTIGILVDGMSGFRTPLCPTHRAIPSGIGGH